MFDPPKKIHVWDVEAPAFVTENPEPNDVAYIRADLVGGLMKALQGVMNTPEYDGTISTSEVRLEAKRTARLALSTLEALL